MARDSISALIGLIALTALSSCARPAEQIKTHHDINDVDRAIAPLKFGSSADELGLVLFVDGVGLLELVSPANLEYAAETVLADGTRVCAVVSEMHKLLSRVRIVDGKFNIGGISLETTFEELRERFPSAEVSPMLGYCVEVRISPRVIVCFFPWDEGPTPDQTPVWIDLLPAPCTEP